jgi:hypothetical protein
MKHLTAIVLFFMFGLVNSTVAVSHELSGHILLGERLFFQDPLYPEQKNNNTFVTIQPEYYNEWESGSSFTATLFASIDSVDSERTHFDIRELNYLLLNDLWELRVGISKVFWGVTEFVHLVDIANQTDLVESLDGEEKLGQPMVAFSLPMDWGTIDLFLLPYFRERTFPGPDGRPRSQLEVDTDNAEYESDDKENHIDFAGRYSHTMGDWEIGLSHFRGTGREPTLDPGFDNNGNLLLTPYYEQINQTGLELQLITGGWLWKLESIYRTGQSNDDYFSNAFGLEYTLSGILGTPVDVGILTEYIVDERGEDATTPYQNEIAMGVRLAFNDISSAEALIGVLVDVETSARLFTVEASRRFGDNWKLIINSWIFSNQPDKDLLYSLRDDDFFQLEIAYYF